MTTRREVSPRDSNDNNKNQDTQNRNYKPLQAGRNIAERTSNITLPDIPGTGMEAFSRALTRFKSGETEPPSETPTQFPVKDDPLTSLVMQEMVHKFSLGQSLTKAQELNLTGNTEQLGVRQLIEKGEPIYKQIDDLTDQLIDEITENKEDKFLDTDTAETRDVVLDTIKNMSGIALDQAYNNIQTLTRSSHSKMETRTDAKKVQPHFLLIKQSHSIMNMPDADMTTPYNKKLGDKVYDSYMIIKSDYSSYNKIIKNHCRSAGFKFDT